jgi:hypothetical protein
MKRMKPPFHRVTNFEHGRSPDVLTPPHQQLAALVL